MKLISSTRYRGCYLNGSLLLPDGACEDKKAAIRDNYARMKKKVFSSVLESIDKQIKDSK